MTMTDPIADMLTRIRNANAAYYRTRNAFLALEDLGWLRRSRWTLKFLHRASLDVAAEAQRPDHHERVSAVACAVSDALRGRYGARASTTAPGWARVLKFWGARFARAT